MKLKVQDIDPKTLKVPPVRITSAFDEDVYKMFATDIEKVGVEQPLLVAKSGEDLWIVDGKNRRDQALLQGLPTVPCIVREMSLKDVQLRNLVTNRLRGRTKVTEEMAVVRDLYKVHAVTIEEIVEKTGMSRERVEDLLVISNVDLEVFEALDQGRIKLCHARQLARLTARDAQLRMLYQVLQFHMPCQTLKEAIDEALRMIAESEKGKGKQDPVAPPPPVGVECHICHGHFPPRQIASLLVCQVCYGIAVTSQMLANAEQKSAVSPAAGAAAVLPKSEERTEGGA